MKVKDLRPSAYNPRKITDKKLEMLKKSMETYGDLSGIIFNRRTGNVIGGHQRIKHLQSEWEIIKEERTDDVGTIASGHIKTPFGDWVYREVDWDRKKEMAANIAANKGAGEWDYPLLKDLLIELDDGAFNLELTGFEEEELEGIFGKTGKDDGGIVPPKDPNILVRLSFHPGVWLGKREEIQKILEQMTKTYSCTVRVDE